MLEDVVNEMFPDSKIHLVVLADKLLVKGQAKDSEEAAQIMTIVRAQGQSRRRAAAAAARRRRHRPTAAATRVLAGRHRRPTSRPIRSSTCSACPACSRSPCG